MVRVESNADTLRHRVASLHGRIQAAHATAQDYEAAATVIRSYSDEQSQKIKSDIEDLVTYGVQSVFDDPSLRFRVTGRVLRGAPSIEFSLESKASGGVIERPVMGSHGGGLAEVTGFILRVVVALLSGRRRLLVLDEPFARVSANYRPRLAGFIREICDKTGLDLLIVTHDEDLPEVADTVYRLGLRGGVTRVVGVSHPTVQG